MFVARPVVLYVRDAHPITAVHLQDVRRGGIPASYSQFGHRTPGAPTRSYSRQITNLGYYWAPNDYFDLTCQLTG
jgi:hypothetical protein